MSKTPKPISAKEFKELYEAAERRRASAPAPKKTEREDIGMAEARRRAHKEATREKRVAWLKRLGVIGLAAAAVWGWFGRGKTDKSEEKTNVVVHQWFVDNGNADDADYDYDEPVYHPENGRVSLEIPLRSEHSPSSSEKATYHEVNAGMRDVVYDAGATVDSVSSLAGSVAGVLDGIGDVQNAHYRTAAQRERLKRQKETDKARVQREKLRVERAKISNEQAKQNMQLQRQREAQREAERLRRIREKEAQRLERERKAARQAAEKAAAAQRRAAEAAARKAEADRRKAEAEARRFQSQLKKRKKRVAKQEQKVKALDRMIAAVERRIKVGNAVDRMVATAERRYAAGRVVASKKSNSGASKA